MGNRFSALVLTSALLVRSASAGNVLVVNAHGPGNYTQIQPAVNAAADGDTILIKSGTYAGFTVASKGLSIAADTGNTVVVTSPVIVTGVGAPSFVSISGLDITVDSTSSPSLDLSGNSGAVRVQTCTIRATGTDCSNGMSAVRVSSDPDTALTRCTLQGADGDCCGSYCTTAANGGSALVAQSSQIALYDCILHGGLGGSPPYPTCYGPGSGSGATACVLADTFLFACTTRFQGGVGGQGADAAMGSCYFPLCWPGDGGTGGGCVLVNAVFPPPPNVVLFACALTPGAGGRGGTDSNNYCDYYSPGYDGTPIIAPSGYVRQTSGQGRRLAAPGVARGIHRIPLEFHGVPGESVWIYLSEKPSFDFDPFPPGVHLTPTAPPVRFVRLGTLPSNGTLDTEIVLSDYGVPSRTFFVQSLFGDPTGYAVLGSPLTLVELASGY